MDSAENDINQMQDQINQYGSITQFGIRVIEISGTADDPNQTSGMASKTDKGFKSYGEEGYNGTWEIGNWGDTLRFTNCEE